MSPQQDDISDEQYNVMARENVNDFIDYAIRKNPHLLMDTYDALCHLSEEKFGSGPNGMNDELFVELSEKYLGRENDEINIPLFLKEYINLIDDLNFLGEMNGILCELCDD